MFDLFLYIMNFHFMSVLGTNMLILFICIVIFGILSIVLTFVHRDMDDIKYFVRFNFLITLFTYLSLILLRLLFFSNTFIACGIGLSGLLIVFYISNHLLENSKNKDKLFHKIIDFLLIATIFCSIILVFCNVMKFVILF